MSTYTLLLIVYMFGGTSAQPVSVHTNVAQVALSKEVCEENKAQLTGGMSGSMGLNGGPWAKREAYCLKEE